MPTVSETALRSRVRRRLARDGERLVTPRAGTRAATDYGPHFIVDERNIMQAWCCDLESLARELGVLRERDRVG